MDDAGIYWTDHTSGDVKLMALDGGGVTIIASGQAAPLGIAVTPTHVFWSNAGDNTLQGTSKSMFDALFFASASKPLFLAASPTVLFWTNAGSDTLEGASLADGGIERDSDAGGASPWDVALNGTTVFWTTGSGVWSAPLTGGNGAVAAKDPAGAVALAVTATTIYWTNDLGTVHAQAIAGGTQSPIHSGEAKPTGMAADDADVYWVDQGTGNVYRAPLDATNDTKTQIIAAGQASPYRIAVDSKFVYWTNNTGGTVARLAK